MNWVKMLVSIGDYKKDKRYCVDEIPEDWTEDEVYVKAADPVEEKINEFKKTLEDREEKLVSQFNDALKSAATKKVPATVKEDDSSLGEFIVAVGKMSSTNPEVREKNHNLLVKKYNSNKAQTEGTATEGGYLVPEAYLNELLMVPGYEAVMWNRVRKIPVGKAKKLYIPTLDQTVTPSGGSSAYHGGLSVSRVAEGAAPASATSTAFKQLEFSTFKWLGNVEITQELLDDSPISVEPLVTDLCRRTIVSKAEYEILNGTGSNQLQGIVDDASVVKIARNTASDFKAVDAAKMYARLLPSSRNSAVWIVHPLVIEKLLQLEDSGGNVVWIPNANAAPTLTLHGLPVYTSEASPGIASDGCVMLCDLQYYLVAISRDVRIESSKHFKFDEEEVVYRFSARVDGKPQITAPVLLQDGTTEVTPFVQLDNISS